RGDEVMAAPVYLPADPEIGARAVPALPERRAAFVRNTKLLLREAHPGPAWPAILAYSAWGLSVAVWIGLMVLTATRPDSRSGVAWTPPQGGITASAPLAGVLGWSQEGWRAPGASGGSVP
ncbi:MAG: hypothetical protein ACRDIF_03430, partial [Actinomycetota bacterium]